MPATAPPEPRLTDPAEFARIYDRHADEVFRAAVSVLRDPTDAQDVAQEVFLTLWRRPKAFDPSRGELGSYLRMIARSRALDLLRRKRTATDATARLRDGDPVRPGEDAGAVAERAALSRTVHTALAKLPHAQREALVLNHLAGLTAEQIASRRSLPVGTVKSRMRLGLQRLRQDAEVQAA